MANGHPEFVLDLNFQHCRKLLGKMSAIYGHFCRSRYFDAGPASVACHSWAALWQPRGPRSDWLAGVHFSSRDPRRRAVAGGSG